MLKNKYHPKGITKADRLARASENLIQQDFTAESPNQKWLGDITEIPTAQGKLYLAAVMDCFDSIVLKGTQFTIRLPIPATLVEENEQQADDKLSDRSLRILIIDDIPDIAQVLSSLLELLGHKTTNATNGAEGISVAREYKPDVILCVIGLPGMNGYKVARSIRKEIDLRDVRLIALSGYDCEDDLNKAISSGFDKHLAKPVDMDVLHQVLRDIV